MKPGDIVQVCFDGKWSRRIPGLVLAKYQHTKILVQFEFLGETQRMYFRRKKRTAHAPNANVWWSGAFKLLPDDYDERTERFWARVQRAAAVREHVKLLKGKGKCGSLS